MGFENALSNLKEFAMLRKTPDFESEIRRCVFYCLVFKDSFSFRIGAIHKATIPRVQAPAMER